MVLAALPGCGEPPSYQLRWTIVEAEAEAGALERVLQCSSAGVSSVQITTLRGGGDLCTAELVDQRRLPCRPESFGAGEPVDGPTLEPGDYTVLVQGLRRNDEPWYCAADDIDLDCVADPEAGSDAGPCTARQTVEVSVSEGTLPQLEAELLAPFECDDGIDNDRDGKVDGQDPGCIIDASGAEAAETGVTLFQTTVSFLDTRAVLPVNVGVDSLQLSIDGEPVFTVGESELDLLQWPFRLPVQASRTISDGSHMLSMTALGADDVALTQALETSFTVDQSQATFVPWEVAFTSDTFLEPIVQPLRVSFTLALSDERTSTCELGGVVGIEPIPVDRLRVLIRDENMQPLDAASLGLTGNAHVGGSIMPIDEAGGWISFECPVSAVTSQALPWGRYTIEIEAQAGGDLCFAWAPDDDWKFELAPQPSGAQGFELTREPGPPAPGCVECGVNGRACSGQICVDGICVDK